MGHRRVRRIHTSNEQIGESGGGISHVTLQHLDDTGLDRAKSSTRAEALRAEISSTFRQLLMSQPMLSQEYQSFFRTGYVDNDSKLADFTACLLYTSPSPRDRQKSRMPSSA